MSEKKGPIRIDNVRCPSCDTSAPVASQDDERFGMFLRAHVPHGKVELREGEKVVLRAGMKAS